MSDSFWLSDAQMARIEPYFPLSHGIARVDDRRVLSGIIHVIRKQHGDGPSLAVANGVSEGEMSDHKGLLARRTASSRGPHR